MAFGEKRRGRPPNRPNKVTAETVKRALETGKLPSDQLLTLGRLAVGMASRLQAALGLSDPKLDLNVAMNSKAWEEFKAWVQLAIDANTKAAPYFSYRLATLKLERGIPDLSAMSDDELDEVERVAGLLTAGRGNSNGEGSALN